MNQEKTFFLTKKGLENIKKEYEVLKDLKAAKLSGEAPKILDSEDLNPEYVSFHEDLEFLETRISEIENVMKNVSLIGKPEKEDSGKINLGAKVVVDINGEDTDEFEILGTLEADPSIGKISNESPVGKALMGRQVGEQITISSPVKTTYTIKKIKYENI
jgi:transcription elongation factor GreA